MGVVVVYVFDVRLEGDVAEAEAEAEAEAMSRDSGGITRVCAYALIYYRFLYFTDICPFADFILQVI